jgi:acyl-CoA thioester hydrolase
MVPCSVDTSSIAEDETYAGGWHLITHTETMRVQWVDTDASGLIHYTAALRYFEVAEHQLMRKLSAGGNEALGAALSRGFALPRVHVEADYRSGLRYPDEFECTARIERIGRSSVTYGFEAHRSSDRELCLSGRIVAAAMSLEDSVSMALPADFRAMLERAL